MTRYAALLRGINVGAHNRIGMAPLRTVVTDLGFDDVATLLQSGNVVFSGGRRPTSAIERELEKAIERELGMSIAVMVRTAAEVERTVADNPFAAHGAAAPTTVFASFLSERPKRAKLDALDPSAYAPDEVEVRDDVAYLHYPYGLAQAKLPAGVLEKLLGVRATARNWNTVTKLVAMLRA